MLSAAELRARVGLDAADASQDALLEQLEEDAVAHLEELTRRHFGEPTEITETVPRAGGYLFLKETPVPGSVVVESRGASGYAVVDADLYNVEGSSIRLNWGAWPGDFFRVRYTAGYAPGTEPRSVRRMVAKLVAREFNLRGTEGIKSKSDSGFSWTKDEKWEELDEFVNSWRYVNI